jgi:hypothetical protein
VRHQVQTKERRQRPTHSLCSIFGLTLVFIIFLLIRESISVLKTKEYELWILLSLRHTRVLWRTETLYPAILDKMEKWYQEKVILVKAFCQANDTQSGCLWIRAPHANIVFNSSVLFSSARQYSCYQYRKQLDPQLLIVTGISTLYCGLKFRICIM